MAEDEKRFFQSIDIISFVVLLLAFALFYYMAFYRTAEQNRVHFSSLARESEQELGLLSEALLAKAQATQISPSEQNKEGLAPNKGSVSDVPMFLQKINAESIASGMELSHIEKLDDTTYRLTAFAPFYRLVHFLYRVEEANLAIQDLDIQPFSTLTNQIRITLKVIGRKMSRNNELALKDFHRDRNRAFRDPFQKDPGTGEPARSPDVIDLTWKFKLTGIGFGKQKSANIDRKKYSEGDLFNTMRIVRIQRDRVDLESGSQRFFISFRYKKPVRE
jgi:hypothetical protein